jgi:serine/threonine protein kinase
METGRVIAGKFRLIREIGQGGMGAVWAAVHETLGREVAVKFMHPQVNHTASLTERFVSEARMVASIKHRFVVDVFDFGVTEDGLYYMVLELLSGPSLASRMDHGPTFPVQVAVQLMADCLRGLQVVHDAGIVHRDLKPDNIFVIEDADGTFPKLIDFGISKRTEAATALAAVGSLSKKKSRLTQPGMVVGTPFYMSPEQLRGRNDIDQRADVYSVGVILYELLAGRLPFTQDNLGDLMVAITVHGAPSLSVVRPDLGPRIAQVVARALAAEPEHRYPSALKLRDALLNALPELPPDAQTRLQANGELATGEHTSVQLLAAKSPFVESMLPARMRARFAPATWLLALGALLFGAVAVWWLQSSDAKTVSLPLHVTNAADVGAEPAQPNIVRPYSPPELKPAAVSGAAQPTADVLASPAVEAPVVEAPHGAAKHAPRAPRATSATPHARPAGTSRPAHPEGPQKLFRKLDF